MQDHVTSDIERLRRLKTLLEQALDLPESERANWLNTLPSDDRPLAPTLSAMLARARQETDDFMSGPPPLSLIDSDDEDMPPDRPGDVIGPYRLIRALGAGGMASVWLAERADGSLNRQVALKLPIAGYAPGLVRRMARERDLLASLEHPHIARLYDAGATPTGRPWLAMQWIDGTPIDAHCQAQSCSIEQRLRLMLQVTEAVSHAHAQLIVHRDLKPSNILVTAQGRVFLLDFGVAKLLAGPDHRAADLTQQGARAWTPAYASPEQVAGGPINVATDVYSLGVLLFELLSGGGPYTPARPGHAALEEAIVSGDVCLASKCAAERGLDAAWVRQLRGDLDTILAKALRKDPGARYANVEAFAADVQRHLDGHPVLAQADSRGYRLRKFIGRNRLAVALSTATVAALCSGLGMAAWQAREASQQATLARARFQQSVAAEQFTKLVLTEGIRVDEALTLRDLMGRAEALARSPALATRPAGIQAAQVVADWYSASDMNEAAERLLSHAIDAAESGVHAAFLDDLHCSRALFRSRLGRVAEALPEFEAAIARVRDTDPLSAMKCLRARSEALGEANDLPGSLRDIEAALGQYQRIGLVMNEALAELKIGYGAALFRSGAPAPAFDAFSEAAALLDADGITTSAARVDLHNAWGLALESAGDPRMALEQMRRAAQIEAHRLPADQPSPIGMANQAGVLADLGRFEECASLTAQVLEGLGERTEPSTQLYARSRHVQCLVGLRRLDEAERWARRSAAAASAAGLPETATSVKWLHYANGLLLQAQGRFEEADAELAALQAVYERVNGRTHLVLLVYLARSDIAARRSRWPQAQALATQALQLAEAHQGALPHSANAGRAWLAMARTQAQLGQRQQAQASVTRSIAEFAATLGEEHLATREARQMAASF